MFRATVKTGPYQGFTDVTVKNLHRQEENEVTTMESLKPHPNIVIFFIYVHLRPFCSSSWKDVNTPFGNTFMSFARNRQKHFVSNGFASPRKLLDTFLKNGVVRRDICSKICLLTKDSTLKMSDFGISKVTDATEDMIQVSGCRSYIESEINREKKFSKASDIQRVSKTGTTNQCLLFATICNTIFKERWFLNYSTTQRKWQSTWSAKKSLTIQDSKVGLWHY